MRMLFSLLKIYERPENEEHLEQQMSSKTFVCLVQVLIYVDDGTLVVDQQKNYWWLVRGRKFKWAMIDNDIKEE